MTKEEMLKQIGANLAKARKSKNLSYREVYYHTNIDYSHVSKIEKGRLNFTINTLFELTDLFEIEPRVLFNFE